MVPSVRKQEMHANNVANAKTTGFKRDVQFTKELSRAEAKTRVTRSDWQLGIAGQTFVDFTPGIFDKTGNPLDLAIEGDGFFTLQAEDGSTYLTRAGMFQVNQDGLLEFPGGLTVNGEGGPIEVGNGSLTVDQSGDVLIDGSKVNRIVPQTVDDLSQLEKVGRSLFRVPEGIQLTPAVHTSVRQGYLEAANLDIVREMVDMIVTYRTYEANVKALQSQDNSLDHLFRRVAGDG